MKSTKPGLGWNVFTRWFNKTSSLSNCPNFKLFLTPASWICSIRHVQDQDPAMFGCLTSQLCSSQTAMVGDLDLGPPSRRRRRVVHWFPSKWRRRMWKHPLLVIHCICPCFTKRSGVCHDLKVVAFKYTETWTQTTVVYITYTWPTVWLCGQWRNRLRTWPWLEHNVDLHDGHRIERAEACRPLHSKPFPGQLAGRPYLGATEMDESKSATDWSGSWFIYVLGKSETPMVDDPGTG